MRKSMVLVMIAVALIASTIGFAGASPPAWLDIGNTPAGKHMAAQALQRFQDKGWLPPSVDVLGLVSQYKTYRFGNEYLVAPARAKVRFEYIDGKLEPIIETFCIGTDPPTAYKTTAAAFTVQAYDANKDHYISMWEALEAVNDCIYYGVTEAQRDQVVAAWTSNAPIPNYYTGPPYWALVDTQCFARSICENNTGWLDCCYKTHKLMYDLSPTEDYYELNCYGTAMSKGIWKLHAAAIRSVASTSGCPQSWVSWSPGGNVYGSNCYTLSTSISAGGFTIGASAQFCPTEWVISKQNPAVDYSCCWNGSASSGSAREVGYQICTKVNQCHWPVWDITPSFNAFLW